MKRVFLIVLDSCGAGQLPDAWKFGDSDCNTIKRISASENFRCTNMRRLGLGNIDGLDFLRPVSRPQGAVARLAELSAGKDTTVGHWEIAGLVSGKPLPTYPNGFPPEIIDEFSRQTGRKVLCNKPYSGTDVIRDYGREHMQTGALIVYTSADSVFQIAAHEDIVPVEQLYEYCRIARRILQGEHAVGRVIARPFTGQYPNFERTPNRHDFSLVPPRQTLLDALSDSGKTVYSIGKINDIFAGRGITEKVFTKSNDDGMKQTVIAAEKDFEGLCFVNLVEFDSKYGHRQDVDGYAGAFADFDRWLPELESVLRDEDIVMITADHGCDPGDSHTDHTREYIPLIVFGNSIRSVNLGTRKTFADIGATVAEYLGSGFRGAGQSFLAEISYDTEKEKELCRAAIDAMGKAYVPYSGYKVGAAVLTGSGKIFSGCNVENAAYSPSICAERTTISKAVSEGERNFEMIAVCGGKDGSLTGMFPPCGVCRQVMAEFCGPDMPVLLITGKDTYVRKRLEQLLPFSFNPSNIEP